jgi:hypothetical protein
VDAPTFGGLAPSIPANYAHAHLAYILANPKPAKLTYDNIKADCIRLITIPTMHCEIAAQHVVTSYGNAGKCTGL